MKDSSTPARAPRLVEVRAQELHGPGVIACPHAEVAAWSHHPKVYIDVARTGSGTCPYCGTQYRLREGDVYRAAH